MLKQKKKTAKNEKIWLIAREGIEKYDLIRETIDEHDKKERLISLVALREFVNNAPRFVKAFKAYLKWFDDCGYKTGQAVTDKNGQTYLIKSISLGQENKVNYFTVIDKEGKTKRLDISEIK